jgi:hypothetical protein
MKPEVVKNGRGMVEHLLYRHHNAEKGCSYELQSNVMIQAEMKAVRADGTQVKL